MRDRTAFRSGFCFGSVLGLMVLTAAAQQAAPLVGLPLYFEADPATTNEAVQFVARSPAGLFRLTSTEATVALAKTDSPRILERDQAAKRMRHRKIQTQTIHWQFIGANSQARITGVTEMPGKLNYFIGNQPAGWRTNVPVFAQVQVEDIYPGVKLVYYGNQQQMEYDFVVAPGADPGAIAFRVVGADQLQIDQQGDLVLRLGATQVRQRLPVIYQVIAAERKPVPGGYRLKDPQTVAFEFGCYDPNWPLVIDPVLSYSSFLGGSGSDTGWDMALDGNGNVYIAGETLSFDLPATAGVFQTTNAGGLPGGGGDAFVAKFDNRGSNLCYLTYLGGKGDDAALAIAVDGAGNAYLTGVTDSTNFPTQSAISNHISGVGEPFLDLFPFDAFVTKLNPSGSALIYSTYLGGNAEDQGIDIAVDTNGNAYVTGFTDSTNFPTFPTNALQTDLAGGSDVFVTKISSNGMAFVYSTYLGGTNDDQGDGIAVDSAGRVFVTGFAESTNFPIFMGSTNLPALFPGLTNAFQRFFAGGSDAFLATIDPGGTVANSTFLGGQGADVGFRIRLDSSGNAYVTGLQSAQGFPIAPSVLNPGGVFKSADAGASWSAGNSGLHHNQIQSLAIDPAAPTTLFAGTWRGVARSTDGGATWQLVFNTVEPVPALIITPANPSTVYAGLAGNILLAGATGNLLKSVDGGTNWTLSSTGIVSQSVNKLVLDPQAPATLYAATEVGVFKSTNAATTWSSSGLGTLVVSDLAVNPTNTSTLYAATAGGVARSTDGGASWSGFNNGLTNLLVQALAVDPIAPSTLYAGTQQGPFKSTDAATNWTAINTGLGDSNITVTALAIDPAAPATVYAGTINGLFKSLNSGGSWSPATNDLTALNITVLAISPGSSATLYTGTRGVDSFGGTDAFLAKFSTLPASGGALLFRGSVVFGGNGLDQGWDLAVDSSGNAYIVGSTTSTNFPATNTLGLLSATNNGATDAFVTAINADASAFLYSAYLGGSGDDFGLGIAADPAGNTYITGETGSTNFPTFNAFAAAFGGGADDAFLAKIIGHGQPALSVVQAGSSIRLQWPAFAPEFALESNTNLAASTNWTMVSQAPPATNGLHTVTLPATNAADFFRLKR